MPLGFVCWRRERTLTQRRSSDSIRLQNALQYWGTVQQRKIALLAGLVVAVVLIITSLFAPFLGLGSQQNYLGYKLMGVIRLHQFVLGLMILVVVCVVRLGAWIGWGCLLLTTKRAACSIASMAARAISRRRAASLGLAWTINIAVVLIAIKLFDAFMVVGQTTLPGLDLDASQRSARTLELFPYEGWHMQAKTSAGDFHLGAMGFAVDFDLRSPPEKLANEYRIILIGGSGAQGWGASSTAKTMASVLERLLNEQNDGRHYRVINMAMGSSLTYQNFIALNRWAHPLKPDLILSYSGVNDYVVPLIHEEMRDAHYYFNELNSLAVAARASEMPPTLLWLRWLLPNLMSRTALGYGFKYALSPEYFLRRAKESYDYSYGKRYDDPNTFMDEVVTGNYVQTMQSIKRDFVNTPVLIVWQALHQSELQSHFDVVPGLRKDFYNRMYGTVRDRLSGPGWYISNFFDLNARQPSPEIFVHPSDQGQAILAEYVFRQVRCVVTGQSCVM